MSDSAQSNQRLADLKRRFEADPESRIYLQLADEYRHLGHHPEAVEVLQSGLQHRPRDLSGLMALGRCQLEMGSARAAAEVLAGVVERDPTHIVGNKLLLEAHLQREDFDRASQRIEIYRLLNDRDPELDHLQFRLDRLREDPSEVPTEVMDQHSIFDFPTAKSAAPAGEQVFNLDVAAPKDMAIRADIFAFISTPDSTAPLSVESGVADLFDFLDPRPKAAELPLATLLPAAASVGETLPEPADEPPLAPQARVGEAVESAPPVAEESAAVVPQESAVAFEAESAVATAQPVIEPETVAEAPKSTVTLAELYLEQGHLGDAEKILREILDREPENAAAQASLRQVEASAAGELTASEFTISELGASELGASELAASELTASELAAEVEEPWPHGLTERKITLLKRYLLRLRGAQNVR